MTEGFWIARLRVPSEAAPAFAEAFDALEPAPLSVSMLPDDTWAVEAIFLDKPDKGALNAAGAAVAAAFDIACPDIVVHGLPDRDWVADSLRGLGPVRAGRFRVIGGHLARPDDGRLTLRLEAGSAFGSGHHQTTRGCLIALDRLARRGRFGRVLDLGCGSGVLAIAAARVGAASVLAADIDPIAARTAAANARINGVTIRAITSEGFAAIAPHARFDLILANILAEPLKSLAPAMRRPLAQDGRIVLSGLLADHEAAVRATYRAHGFVLVDRILLGRWPTLVLRRG